MNKCRIIEMSIRLCRYPQKRQAYEFCDHVGPCSTDSICRCVETSTTCERGCGCPPSCRRRFPPCHCVDGCGPKCLCRENAHECSYCGCGKMCSNQKIRNGRSQLTTIRQSRVHGQGLFAEVYIAKDSLIDEYKGIERRNVSSERTAVEDFIISTSETRRACY